jgi:aspartyl aminopeptidase
MSEEMKSRKEKVLAAVKNGYDRLDEAELQAVEEYCRVYKDFLDNGKTERLCAREAVRLAEAAGFAPYRRGMELKTGDKVYAVNRGKGVMLAVIGSRSLAEGCQITASHIDSPRLDLKPTPLYEDSELAYFKTHYYGGIRKYQWVTIPLELRGVVALKDGTVVEVALGEGGEPKFVITDLLPHLGGEQGKKPLNEAIPGESLNILLGSRPVGEAGESDRVKLNVMEKLNEKYGITEADFASAELEVVPAAMATDIGLDASLIGAYGHDDRVCGFAGLKALLDLDAVPAKTAVCMLADKEEIGSMGVTGMQSAAFDTFIHDLCDSQGVPLRVCYENAFCLSTDVTAAFDPLYAEVYEKRNSAHINYGLGLAKYTGARGKGGSSDANAETVAYVRRVLDEKDVVWQMAELGKIDAGGGGTVAQYMANRNIATLDAGVPVLSMHAPFEVVSKLDCYMTYKGCKAVYEAE